MQDVHTRKVATIAVAFLINIGINFFTINAYITSFDLLKIMEFSIITVGRFILITIVLFAIQYIWKKIKKSGRRKR